MQVGFTGVMGVCIVYEDNTRSRMNIQYVILYVGVRMLEHNRYPRTDYRLMQAHINAQIHMCTHID